MLFDLIEESKAIIGIDTAGSTGTRKLVNRLVPYCHALGFRVALQEPPRGSRVDVNLIAHTQVDDASDYCPNGLALVTHLDTVPAGDLSLWTETGNDAYRAALKGDKLYGLGSADTKLDFLCKLLAVELVGLKNLKIPLALIGTFGEERSLEGARVLRDSGKLHPKFALVGEPCHLKAVVAHKGILYLRARFSSPLSDHRGERLGVRAFSGKAAHGSMPHLGDNAVEKALRWTIAQHGIEIVSITGGTVHNVVPERCDMETINSKSPSRRVDFIRGFLNVMDLARKHLEQARNPHFDPPQTTDNIGVIRMVDAETIEIEFDFRLIPETDARELAAICKALEEDVPGANVEVIRQNEPMNTSAESEIARRVGQAQKEVGIEPEFLVKSGNTEGAIFSAMGVQTVVTGPGKAVGNIHAPNEHNEVSQLFKAVDFYAAFLRQFC